MNNAKTNSCPNCGSEDLKYSGQWKQDELHIRLAYHFLVCMSCFSQWTKAYLEREAASQTAAPPLLQLDSAIEFNVGAENRMEVRTMEVFNVIVGDVGKKSVQVGTLFLDKTRKAPLSGYLSKDAISKALADGTVSTKVADPKASRFLQGHQTFRVAAFPIQKRETQESKGL